MMPQEEWRSLPGWPEELSVTAAPTVPAEPVEPEALSAPEEPASQEPAAQEKPVAPKKPAGLEPFIAFATWLLLVVASAAAVRFANLNPLTTRGALFPLACGGIAAIVLAAVAWRRPSQIVTAVAAGALAAWVWFILLQSLQGTPFGFDGLRGDAGRLAAMVTRYTVTWKPVDGIVPSVPTEYPPLFPYVLGHLATGVGHPGWTLLGRGEALAMSLAVLFGFLLWQRLVPGGVALVLAAVPPYFFGEPRKAFEILTYAVGLPWALATFARFRKAGGLHWLPAGVIVGLIVATYQGFVLFGGLGLAAMAVLGWRAAADRWAYVRHVLLVVVTGFVVASWYLVPFLYGVLVLHVQRVNDLYIAGEIHGDPLGVHLFAAYPIGIFNAIGLVGLVVLRRRRWWAAPMLALAAGTFAYRYLYVLIFVLTGHTGNLDYTSRLLGPLLASAGVLTLVTFVVAVARRVRLPDLRRVAVVAAVTALVVITASEAGGWLPTPIGVGDPGASGAGSADTAAYAHAEILPNGSRVHYADTSFSVALLLIPPIQKMVDRILGPNARPSTLSYTERLFAYLPWNGYVAAARLSANSFTHWDDRHAALERLAAVTDPAAFAAASRSTKYGGIDVFVLSEGTQGTWDWNDVQFAPSVFAAPYWQVEHMAHHTVVAVRNP
jgi:Arabinofuranosyltransferase N terminal/Arabinofuranosyltransferase A C terminal